MRVGQLLESQSQVLDNSMVLGSDAEEDDHEYEDQEEEDEAAEQEEEEQEQEEEEEEVEEVEILKENEEQREHETSRVNSLQAASRSAGDEWLDGLVEEAIRDRMALVKARLDDAATALWDELRQVRNAMRTSLAAVHGDVEELAAAMARIGPVFCDVKRMVAAVGCLEERVKRLEDVSCAKNSDAASGGTLRNNTRAGQGSLRSHEESWRRGLEAFREVQQRESDALWGELSKHAAGMQAVWEEVSRVRRVQAEAAGAKREAMSAAEQHSKAADGEIVGEETEASMTVHDEAGGQECHSSIVDSTASSTHQPSRLSMLVGDNNSALSNTPRRRLQMRVGFCADVAARPL